MEKKIKIVGADKEYDYEKIKDSVIRIGGKIKDGERVGGNFYWRTSDLLVKIKGRFYRKESALVTSLSDGSYILRANAVKVLGRKNRNGSYEEITVDREDKSYTKISDGRLVYDRYVASDNKGNYYHINDLHKCRSTSTYIFPSDTALKLSESHYGKDAYIHRCSAIKSPVVIADNGELMFVKDTYLSIDEKGNIIRKDASKRRGGNSVVIGFQNQNYPKSTVSAYVTDKVFSTLDKKGLISLLSEESGDFEFYYLNSIPDYQIKNYIHFHINRRKKIHVAEEDISKTSRKDLEKFTNGGRHIFGRQKNTVSDTYSKTGGIEYSFGVESELGRGSGLLESEANKVGLACISDGSISGNEYVTGVLHGDTGMELLDKQGSLLEEHGYVDDTCGLHVHVGGIKNKKCPSFSRTFSYLAIKLGTQIEEELFMTQPETRDPFNKYCASIRSYNVDLNGKNWAQDYTGITRENSVDMIAEYVHAIPHFSINANRNHNLNRWNKGRYKWLNLTHCNSDSRFTTIEFRLFAGTVKKVKVKNYVLLCLAFTRMIDDYPQVIERGGVTLKEMLTLTLDKATADQVIDFLEKRKKKFARKDIYKGAIDLNKFVTKIYNK